MHDEARVVARRVANEADRRQVIEVLAATYHREKHWVSDPETQIPAGDLERGDIGWFLATVDGRAAGALRVLYDPPYTQYTSYGLQMLDPAVNVAEFLRHNRLAEVGRFAVKSEFRGHFIVAVALMRVATDAVLARGYTHLVTDVFEDDPHTPYRFHTRALGFYPVATHEGGELACCSRRITLLLDLGSAYQQLRRQGRWLYRYLTSEWDEPSHRRLATRAGATVAPAGSRGHRLQSAH